MPGGFSFCVSGEDVIEQAKLEKRATRRFPLRLPVAVRFENEVEHEVVAHTRDVSARGVCFYIDSPMEPGTAIEFTLTLPPEITLTESIRVRCRGRIVRIEEENTGKVGVAAIIEEYEFVGAR